jgi:hypothetical protein
LCLALLPGDPGRVRVEVLDDAAGLPQLQSPSPAAPRGRGLQIVQALAARWGVEPHEDGWKAVWAEVEVPVQDAGPFARRRVGVA